MKFLLFVEGEAERRVLPGFLKRWLDPKLSRRVGIDPVLFSGCGDYLNSFKKKALFRFNGPDRDEIIAIMGLLDLYGLPNNFFPAHLIAAPERYDWAKKELESRIGHQQFQQFFAVHELEAWLLSDPSLFLAQVRNAFPGTVAKPESVNFNQPPCQLLQKLYSEKLKRRYNKIVDGSDLFSKLDPELAYQKCSRLQEMLKEMLRLAQERGN